MSFWDIIKPAQAREPGKSKKPAEPNYTRLWQKNFGIASVITLAPLLAVLVYCLRRGYLDDPVLIWLLCITVPLSLLMVFISTLRQVGRLKDMNSDRGEMLKEIVYTHKMAAVGRLAAGVAHEINNPMAVIREKAGLIQDLITHKGPETDWERVNSLVKDIQQSARRAGEVTHRLLGFATHLNFEAREFNPGQVVRNVVGLFRQKAHYRDIAVEVEAKADIPAMHSDPGALEQVIFNLLDNAFYAVQDGGSIGLKLAAENGRDLIITMYDDGQGIDPEDMKHIFEPFYSTWGVQHAGMGLSITYGIVHKLGGEIYSESDLGDGATFIVRLPLVAHLEADQATEDEISHYALHAKGSGD